MSKSNRKPVQINVDENVQINNDVNVETVETKQRIRIDVTFRQNDGTAGKCARCARPFTRSGLYTSFNGHNYGPECIVHVQAALDQDVDINHVHDHVRTQHRKLMSETTKIGLAKKKQQQINNRERVDNINNDAYDLLSRTS
jgi:hypothetical protein